MREPDDAPFLPEWVGDGLTDRFTARSPFLDLLTADLPPPPPLGRRERLLLAVHDVRQRAALRIAPWLEDGRW